MSKLTDETFVIEPCRDGDGGFYVYSHTIGTDLRSPSAWKESAEAAVARLAQLMGLKTPVTPQNYPEQVCIGYIESDEDTP